MNKMLILIIIIGVIFIFVKGLSLIKKYNKKAPNVNIHSDKSYVRDSIRYVNNKDGVTEITSDFVNFWIESQGLGFVFSNPTIPLFKDKNLTIKYDGEVLPVHFKLYVNIPYESEFGVDVNLDNLIK